MEVLTCVKNTFVEFADAESPKFEHRRSRSIGCPRDLQFHKLQSSTNHTSYAALDDIGLHETGATGKKNSEIITQTLKKPGTGTTAVAQLAASLPKGYSLTLTHHGEPDTAKCKHDIADSKTTSHKPTAENGSLQAQATAAVRHPFQTRQVCNPAGYLNEMQVQSPIWSPAPSERVLSSTPAMSWQTSHWPSPNSSNVYPDPRLHAFHATQSYGGHPWQAHGAQVPGATWHQNVMNTALPAYDPVVNSAVAAAAGVASMASLAMAFRQSLAWQSLLGAAPGINELPSQDSFAPPQPPPGWWGAHVQTEPVPDSLPCDYPEEQTEPAPEEEPEQSDPLPEHPQKGCASTQVRKRMHRPLRAPSRRWCCFKIKMHVDRTFHPVRMIIGKGGNNTKQIALQTGAKVRIRGRGSGHIEPATGEEAPTPLMLVVSADFGNTEGYFNALDMSLELLHTVESAYKEHCAATGIKGVSPALVIGSMCGFTASQLNMPEYAAMTLGPR